MEPTIWVLAVLLLASAQGNPAPAPNDERIPISFEEIMSGALTANGFGGTWISGSTFLYRNADGDVAQFNVATNTNTTVLSRTVMESLGGISLYSMSPDNKYLLLSYDSQAQFRHSTTSKYAIYEISSGLVKWTLHNETHLQLATWAPAGSGLAYVLKNNIYYIESMVDNSIHSPIQLTMDGVEGIIYNGVPDWVYEEEVLGSGSAMWFSPDGQSLAYAKFNDTQVMNASYMMYGNPGDIEDQYTKVISIRYPKVGTTNPHVELFVITNLTAGTAVPLSTPVDSVTNEHVLWDVAWANVDEVVATWTNRIQNHAQIRSYNVTTAPINATDELSITQDNGWLNLPRAVFNQTGESYLTLLSWPHESSGNFSHATLVKRQQSLQQLTSGNNVVTSIYGWDTVGKKIYYQATESGYPSRRRVYAISESGIGDPTCLSCTDDCLFSSASFSTDFSNYALTCQGPQTPATVTIQSTNGQSTPYQWETNAALKEVLAKRQLPTIINTSVNVTGGFEAKAQLWLPPNMDDSGNTKYPMIVFVYGGPGSQQITDSFTLGWGAYLASNRSYIYAMIDGRGSALKGDNMLFTVYRSLGTKEVEDQISVTRVLQQTYPYIDANRTGIWGWSYGGYATAMALARDTEGVFKCGISVAPVTSWIYYDSIYTERYMGLPSDNEVGYNQSDVNRLAANFADKDFLLMHGNADDNVHYQQAMVLAKALETKNVLFYQQSYPDENHGIGSVVSHVYKTQDSFWERCFTVPASPTTSGATVTSNTNILLAILLVLATCSISAL